MPSNSELELQNIVTPNDECWTTPGEHCGSCMSDQEYADEHGGMGIDVCCTHHKMLKDLLAWRDRAVEEAQNEVIEWLEADLKRLDGRNWGMDTLALDMIVESGKADEYQKAKRQQIVVDRRAAHALYAILNNYKAHGRAAHSSRKES